MRWTSVFRQETIHLPRTMRQGLVICTYDPGIAGILTAWYMPSTGQSPAKSPAQIWAIIPAALGMESKTPWFHSTAGWCWGENTVLKPRYVTTIPGPWRPGLQTIGALLYEPPHDKTKKMTCAQRRLRSAQSDQSFRCLQEESLGP